MTDLLDPSTHEDVSAPPRCETTCRSPWLLAALVVVVLLAGVAGGVAALKQMGWTQLAPTVESDQALQDKVEALQTRLRAVEDKVALTAGSAAPKTEGGELALSAASGSDIEKLKSGLAGLSGALSLLQTEIEKTSKISNETQMNTRMGLATVLGFLQLQRVALSGQQFEKERQELRKVAEGDQTLIDLLIKLEPYALTGVPTASAMLKQWREKANEAQTALRKASAQTWIDRIVVALEGLVSIRSLNPKAGESLSFAAIEMDLQEDKLKSALEKIAALPPEVQGLLADCQKKIETRVAAEAVLADIFHYLMVRGAQSEPVVPESAVQQDGGTK